MSFSDCGGDVLSGHSKTNDDCEGNDGSIFRGAPETWCGRIDDDCAEYSDYDMDGDGVDSTAEADAGTDCDDTDPDINPDSEEVEGDGVDQDCDGANGSSGSGDVDCDRLESVGVCIFHRGDGAAKAPPIGAHGPRPIRPPRVACATRTPYKTVPVCCPWSHRSPISSQVQNP